VATSGGQVVLVGEWGELGVGVGALHGTLLVVPLQLQLVEIAAGRIEALLEVNLVIMIFDELVALLEALSGVDQVVLHDFLLAEHEHLLRLHHRIWEHDGTDHVQIVALVAPPTVLPFLSLLFILLILSLLVPRLLLLIAHAASNVLAELLFFEAVDGR